MRSQPWIDRCATFLNDMLDERGYASRSVPGGPATLYGTCYASLAQSYIGKMASLPGDVELFLQQCQQPETGLYLGPELEGYESPAGVQHDSEHLALHSTCTAIAVCRHFNVPIRHQLSAAYRFCDLDYLLHWLDSRDLRNPWFEGNNILFAGQLLVYLRDVEQDKRAKQALDEWFGWLDRAADPGTSLWGYSNSCPASHKIYGGYHQLLVYFHENRQVKNSVGLIDAVLELQHRSGGFAPEGNAGACEDVDAVDILVNMYKRVDYRRGEIRNALRRCLSHILSSQNDDGGWPYNIDQNQSHMGIPGTQAAPNISCTFPTWFRVHTLALIAQVIPDAVPLHGIELGFTNNLSMGWHADPVGWSRQSSTPSRRAEIAEVTKRRGKRAISSLKKQARSFAVRAVPGSIRDRIRTAEANKLRIARRTAVDAILADPRSPSTVESEAAFDQLQTQYPTRDGYRYDAASVWRRAVKRAEAIVALPRTRYPGTRALEIGAGDGVLGMLLETYGFEVTLADVDDWRDRRASALPFLQCDACHNVPVSDSSFDVIYSYNSFEHLPKPADAMGEISRVLAPGGVAYLDFGPLYNSPWGLHAYRSLHMPYSQFLLSKEFIAEKLEALGIWDLGKKRDSLQFVNEFSLRQWTELWASSNLRPLKVEIEWDQCSLDVVQRFPSAFRGRGLTFEEITGAHLRVTMSKSAVAPPSRQNVGSADSRLSVAPDGVAAAKVKP